MILAGTPNVSIVLLAAGASSRMAGRDKLLETVQGRPMLRHCAQAALDSKAAWTIVVLSPDRPERLEALAGLDVVAIQATGWREGMAASIRAGVAAAPVDADAVIIALADMPGVTAEHYDRLIAAFAPDLGREICRAVASDGRVGQPVLFGRRFFGRLAELEGDSGARTLLRAAPEFLVDVPTPGPGAVTDIDTAQDWEDWNRSGT